MVHAFGGSESGNYYYTAPPWTYAFAPPPWTNSGTVADMGATLDWSPGGTCYMARRLSPSAIEVLQSSNPANTPFSTIPGSTYAPGPPHLPDKPWVAVGSVTNTDHIYMGFNDTGKMDGKTASIRYSLDGGAHWTTSVIEKITPAGGWDSSAVRLAISPDGTTVYALFERANSVPPLYYRGDVVLVRDDAYGASGYAALGPGGSGTVVVANEMLENPEMRVRTAIAVSPSNPSRVYVAYTEIDQSSYTTRLLILVSTNKGATFSPAHVIERRSMPALAVTKDGTVGLLYGYGYADVDEVHFLKAPYGNFGKVSDRVLAVFPSVHPITGYPNIGDYFTLKAINYDFFGTFCAWGFAWPFDFPSGVVFLRNVNVNGQIRSNFYLTSQGELTDLSGLPVTASFDPFVFYDIGAPFSLSGLHLDFNAPQRWDPTDPFIGDPNVSWPMLPTNQPQFQLETSATLGPNPVWSPATNNTIVQTNGQFLANLISYGLPDSQPQQFYRLRQDLTGAEFQLFAAAGDHGALIPSGILTNPALQNQTFAARPDFNYAISKWYLDGVPVQTNGSSLTVSNIADEHTLTVTFVPSNDLAVTISHPFPVLIFTTNSYHIHVENKGLNLLTGVSLSNALPANLIFVSASTTQGTVSNSSGVVTANIGSLSPGAVVSLIVHWMPLAAGSMTDTVSVACSQLEPDLSNNTATDITTAIEPVAITLQPVSQTVPPGGTASFTVAVSGTPPFLYQWAFNGTYLPGAIGNPNISPTNTLTVTNVSAADAGSYSVSVFQMLGPEEISVANSTNATLTLGPPLVTRRSSGSVPAPARTTR